MRTDHRLPIGALVAMVVLAVAAPASAVDPLGANCEVPLFVQQGSIDANVMILFDNSGSMNSMMYHEQFDPFTVWAGPFDPARTYLIRNDGNYRPRDVPGRPGAANQNTPRAPLRRSFNQQGRYDGNYLNWIFYHATDEQRDSIPTYARIHVAQAVVSDIIDRSQRVRFGLTVFRFDNGGRVIAECGADKDALINTVQQIEGDSWTPLGESLETVLDYYKRDDNDAPIIADCQKNFVIVITDGYPTRDRAVSAYLVDADGDGNDPGNCTSIGSPDPNNNDCSDHLDDIAYWMANNDMRPDLEDDQFVWTYTIGFGIDASILQDTADNGDGLYLMAGNAADLWTSLELVMLDIISRISSGAAVAVVSTERGDDERLYRGKFMPGSWHGYLESFRLPYEDGDSAIWEAGHLLMNRAASTREIFTATAGNFVPFTDGNAASLVAPMGVADSNEAAEVIAWTRGEDVAGLRNRDGWKLGDIIHSTPVVVGAPANFTDDPDYGAFMANHENRTKMVYVGSNDGMLHAFYAATGQEAWAFIPRFALPKLPEIAADDYCHTYAVDLTPTVRDCQLGGAWKTVLVGGGRQGGAGYFALDVTNPAAPDLLWQIELPNGKAFASEVEFATINNEAVVLMGSGLDETDGQAWLEVYKAEDGAHLGSVLLSEDNGHRNRATAANVIDRDLDGNHDAAYVADLQGHVWKLEFGGSLNPALWDRYCLWNGNYEITSRPMPAYGDGGAVYVYFGTGAYLDESDISSREANIFGCVIDRNSGMEYANLRDQTAHVNDVTGEDGWFIRLTNESGERITEPAAIVAGSVFFTSFVPSQEVCDAGGNSWLYRLDYRDGGVPDDGEDDDWDGNRSIDLDQGVASRPVVDVVNEKVIVQSSDATITVQDIGQAYFHLTVRSWQEAFDYVITPTDTMP